MDIEVLFLSMENEYIEEIVLALRVKWEQVRSVVALAGSTAMDFAEEHSETDLIILPDPYPGDSTISIIHKIRRTSDVPIIVVGKAEREIEILDIVREGADDYIVFPCNPLMVTARAIALIRRASLGGSHRGEDIVHCGSLVINPVSYEVALGGKPIVLTPTEFKVLYVLAKNSNSTTSQEELLRRVWSEDIDASSSLTKYIQRLRRKLGDDARNPTLIKTVHGFGYRIVSSG